MDIMLLTASILGTAAISYLIYYIKLRFIKNEMAGTVENINEKHYEQKKNLFKDFIEYMNDVMNIFSTNMYFSFDNFRPNSDYNLIGSQIFLTEGVILEKRFISKDDVVNNIAEIAKEKPINTTDDTVKDYHIVKLVSKHNSKEYVLNNKSLFESVEQSDIVFLTIVDNEIHNIGFVKRNVNEG